MSRFTRRRTINVTLLLLVCALFYVWHTAHAMTLSHPSLVSGWALAVMMLFLTAYNARKKLTFLPLGRSSTWLQLHSYAGVLGFFLFALHTGPRLPNGALEVALWVLFLLAAVSGVGGLYVTRRFPPLLASRGEEVIFERIPRFYDSRLEEVEQLVLQCAQDGSTAIPDFFTRRLYDFMAGPLHFWAHMRESRRPLQRLLEEMRDLNRFLGPSEREVLEELKEFAKSKDDLDYHYAHQSILKYWLFLHIPLAYGTLMLTVLHVLLVHAFGGIR